MFGQVDEGVGVEVDARDGAGVVVDEDRDWGRRRQVLEVLDEGVWRVRGLVVRRRQHQGRVGAHFVCLLAELDGFSRRLRACAGDDWEVVEAGVVERLAGHFGYDLALFVAQVDGFAVRALGGDALQASLGQAHGVLRDGLGVEIFRVFVEEADGRDVDARFELPQSSLGAVHGAVHGEC